MLLLAALAPLLWSDESAAVDTARILQGPSPEHLLGTDNLGRDILYRVLVATRSSVGMALLSTAIGVITGIVVGMLPAVLGQATGRLVTAAVDIAVAFPGLLLVLFFAVIFGAGAEGAVLAIGFAAAPAFARLTQTLVAGVTGRDFVAAARVAGVGKARLVARHILPNIGEPLVVNATISASSSLLSFAGLSFLGLGVQAPSYDWGRLLGEGLNGIYLHPGAALAPGVAIVVAGLAFNLFGEVMVKELGQGQHLVQRRFGARTQGLTSPKARTAVDLEARPAGAPVLAVENLQVHLATPAGHITPVRGVGFTVGRGEAVGVVGESGSGKSLTAMAVAQLVEEPGIVTADRLEFLGTCLLDGDPRAHRRLLGTSLAMVFQDPMTSFNPTRRIGRQLADVAAHHQGLGRRQALERAVDRLQAVRIPAPERRAWQYPHEFSGGMRQRAMIGMGVMGTPSLIVADEPTTALDATVQRQVLRLLDRIRAEDGVAILFISHDITVVGQLCDRVLVMYAGRIVEDLPANELLQGARHPYTRALVAAVPDMDSDREQPLIVIPGQPVDAARPPNGCAYAARCLLADERCRSEEPELTVDPTGRRVACWHAGEETGQRSDAIDASGRSE
ncbi:dipeptide/oligopeptide/nickel ABC transporter permease/ATP-binding protein [Streptomyces chartreusis]